MQVNKIPTSPGCYLFIDKNKKIIYIGKAKNLRKRVSNYFNKKDHDTKTNLMVSLIKNIDFIVTRNEVEALILENNLIKKNNPKYNIDLKDSKRYAYIELTKEDFPRLLVARKRIGNSKFFGPFVSAGSRDYILYVLKKTFQIRTCKRLPKKACLRYHLDLCSAPCISKISKKNYKDRMNLVESILNGKSSTITKILEKKMENASKNSNFEKAIELRDQIESIRTLKDKQMMERQKKYDEDIINYIIKDKKVYLMLFNVYKGILENKQEFEFDNSDNFFEEFLARYYSNNPIPKQIIVPEHVDSAISIYLNKLRKNKVIIEVPQKGDKKELLNLVLKNIELSFFGDYKKLEELKKKLNLEETPSVIECFDISHLSGTSTVASLAQFRNAIPDKTNYRKFKIRTVVGVDDVRAIAEVVRRRYSRLIKEKLSFPNLIVIDGGIAQLNFAKNELEKLNLKIPIISIAKEFEEIHIPGNNKPLRLSKKDEALKLIQKIRNEAHRFAISYNKLLRKKEMFK